jgi:hypothetical protein
MYIKSSTGRSLYELNTSKAPRHYLNIVTYLKRLTALFVVSLLPISAYPNELVVAGIYYGQNLLVQNPSMGNKVYCTDGVLVNNRKMMPYIASSAYEINLSFLKINDSVTVTILHKDGCTPKIINPQVLRPSSTFHFVRARVSVQEINWTSIGESVTDQYSVQHLANGNWVTLVSIRAIGKGVYSVPLRHDNGLNRYRIRYAEYDGRIFYSKEIDFDMKTEENAPLSFYPKNVTDRIYLSSEATYRILSLSGQVLREGKSRVIPCADLKTGVYVLAAGAMSERFFKK